jgi:hypothetical protein
MGGYLCSSISMLMRTGSRFKCCDPHLVLDHTYIVAVDKDLGVRWLCFVV